MTKEELIKLSRENLKKSKKGSLCECYDEAFVKGYQLSEKRIAELELKIKHLTEHLEPQSMTALFEQVEEEVKQEQRLNELEKENSRLNQIILGNEEEITDLRKDCEEYSKTFNRQNDEIISLRKKMIKAKEIITNLVKFDGSYKNDEEYQRKCELYDKMWAEAEKFLKG